MVVFRGVPLGPRERERIARVVADRPRATRDEWAREICKRFGWLRPNGEPPVRACTELLERLARKKLLNLPACRAPRVVKPGRKGEDWEQLLLDAASAPLTIALDATAPLVVRPIVEPERVGWHAYMQRYHYLGDCRLVGESMRYVALLGDELVALLAWGAAALCNEPRDSLLGWDRSAKADGLKYIVNNVRFLVLPWVKVPHLASRILGANLRRLSRDYESLYGHRVVLAETFVDSSRFSGTCYRASNWRYVGETKGWAKQGCGYAFHGRPKAAFIYPLHRRSFDLLRTAPGAVTACSNPETSMRTLQCEELPIEGKQGLFAVLGTIADPRHARGVRHPIQSVLAVATCATLAGAKSFAAIHEWAADQSKQLRLRLRCWRGRAPSERTIRRVLQSVNVQQTDNTLGQWFANTQQLAGRALALDGKTLRGSRDGDQAGVHLLAAVVHGSGEVVAQTRVDRKTNEITRVAPLLRDLDIRGTVITGDALLTQRELARHLVEDKQADYVFTAKDNQPTLRADIQALHLEDFPPQHTTIDKGHGRIELRHIRTSTELNGYINFPHVGQVFCIERITTDLDGNVVQGRKSTRELCFGLTSLSTTQATPQDLLQFNREHWHIENRLHHVRDMTWDEDRSQVRRGNRPHAMASLRNTAISLLRLAAATNIAAATRELNRHPEAIMRLIGL